MSTRAQRRRRREARLSQDNLGRLRERAAATVRDGTVHVGTTRAQTVDQDSRSVESVLATSARALVYSLRDEMAVDEVLVMSGFQQPAGNQVVLFDSHPEKYMDPTSRDVRGSCRQLRVDDEQLIGRNYFAGDEQSLELWSKVADGHITDNSPQILPLQQTRIEPGESATVAGTTYEADAARPLYITQQWTIGENSVTPHGADPLAKFRHSPRSNTMPPRLLAFLRARMNNAEATEQEARDFAATLRGRDQAIAAALAIEADDQRAVVLRSLQADPADPARDLQPDPAPQPGRDPAGQDPPPPAPAPTPTARTNPQPADEGTIRAQERQRISDIYTRAGYADLPQDDSRVRQAIDEGWTPAEASDRFLESLRSRRPQAPPADPATSVPGQAPAGHVRSHDGDCTVEVLQATMILRSGVALDDSRLRGREAQALIRSGGLPAFLSRDANDDSRQRVMDLAHRYDDYSLVDICREAVRLDRAAGINRNYGHGRSSMIRSAISGANLVNVFTTNVNAQVLGAYMDAPDTTMGWISEVDVADFRSHDRIQMNKFGALSKHARGGAADHGTTDDRKESSKIARYSEQFAVDEMDIIDDRFGAINSLAPADLGLAAAQLRPDLVYAILLANGNLDQDSTALFAAGHSNIDTNAFSAANLQAGLTKMGNQRLNNRPLNVNGRYLIGPRDLEFDFDVVLRSAERRESATSDGTRNPLRDRGITPVNDARLGASGVTDPDTGTAYSGSTTNWFLSARPGENGAKTLVVKYRRGTGRAPEISSWMKDGQDGEWKLGWAVKHDIGADADDYLGLYKGNS